MAARGSVTIATRPGPARSPLGEWIRQTRVSQGVSQRALADRSGVSRSYLCDIERGRGALPRVATLDKLAAALGASRADLLRVAGVLESTDDPRDHAAERHLLALYRDISPEGRAMIERFLHFVHTEEHRWVQTALIDTKETGDDELAPEPAPVFQGGPTLFDAMPGPSDDPVRRPAGRARGTGRAATP
jgi:transcriptional regulator with XRE-family HTH domain